MPPSFDIRSVRAVVLDVGETLVDETRAWTVAAHRAGVTPFTLMAVMGALIERGEPHDLVWEILGFDAPSHDAVIDSTDLYPDALECLRDLRSAGLVVGIAGNQPAGAEEQLVRAGFRADFVASSARWGVAKPAPEFFDRVVAAAGVPAGGILYVGDRIDNDLLPARRAGMRTAFLRRGPWGCSMPTAPRARRRTCDWTRW